MGRLRCLVALVLLSACGEEPPFPVDYQDAWLETRGCSEGSVHGGSTVKIHINDTGQPTWDDWAARVAASSSGVLPAGEMIEFPVGTVLLKAQYADPTCTTLSKWTMMTRLATGADVANGNWRFEEVAVGEDGTPQTPQAAGASCFSCHQAHRRYNYVGHTP